MICNRKFLAFTSKTPGKTSEFNYFDAKGIVGKYIYYSTASINLLYFTSIILIYTITTAVITLFSNKLRSIMK